MFEPCIYASDDVRGSGGYSTEDTGVLHQSSASEDGRSSASRRICYEQPYIMFVIQPADVFSHLQPRR